MGRQELEKEESASIRRGLHRLVLNLIEKKGWKQLNDIQIQAIETIRRGDNCIIVAPTGYGKTEAAILPVLSEMLVRSVEPVTVIYITPLKALINDIYERIKWWAEPLGFRVARKHGDVPLSERAKRYRKVPHIIVTTPESLEVDLDWAPKFRKHYRNLQWIIVDEVHEIVSNRRGVQLAILLERFRKIAGDFQLIMLSATIGDPEGVAKVFTGSSKRRVSVVSTNTRKNMIISIDAIPKNSTNNYWRVVANKILEHIEPLTIVFVNSKSVGEHLHQELSKISKLRIAIHHASISADDRNAIEESAKSGEIDAIIATKTLELGIDLGYVKKVILYRPVGSASALVQRVGRSGHKIGSIAKGVIIVTNELDLLEALAEARLVSKGIIEKPLILNTPLDMVARALIGAALSKEYTKDDMYYLLKNIVYFRNLTRNEYDTIVRQLVSSKMLKIDKNSRLKIGPQFYKIWRFNVNENKFAWWVRGFTEFFTTMGEKLTYIVKNGQGRIIGELDADYVIKVLRIGDVIKLGNSTWQVVGIDEHSKTVLVVEAHSLDVTVPFWKGQGPEPSSIVIEELERLIEELHRNHNVVLAENIELTSEAKKLLDSLINEIKRYKYPPPSSTRIVIDTNIDETFYIFLSHPKIVRTIAYLVLKNLSRENTNSFVRISQYGFSIPSKSSIDPIEYLLSIDEDEFYSDLLDAVEKSPFFFEKAQAMQLFYGIIKKIDRNNKYLYSQILRQTLSDYFDVKGALEFIQRLKRREIEVLINPSKTSIYAKALVNEPPEKLWVGNVSDVIAEILEDMAFTAEEIADAAGLPVNVIISRLQDMQKPGSKYRVFSFIDVDTGEVRWALTEYIDDIVNMEEFESSFKPRKVDSLYMATLKSGGATIQLTVNPIELLTNTEKIVQRIPFEEIQEVKVTPLTSFYEGKPIKFNNVNRRIIPYLLLNAIAYLQKLQQSSAY